MGRFIEGVTNSGLYKTQQPVKTYDEKTRIDHQGFTKLWLAQMANQDPLEPQDNSEAAVQQAQFAQLEQTTLLNQRFQTFSTNTMVALNASLIGKEVAWQEFPKSEDGTELTNLEPMEVRGVVTSVGNHEGSIYVTFADGKSLRIEDISVIGTPQTEPEEPSEESTEETTEETASDQENTELTT